MHLQDRALGLRTGAAIPRIGLGTFRSQGEDVKRAVLAALKLHGVRHIDTATIYKVCACVDAGAAEVQVQVQRRAPCEPAHGSGCKQHGLPIHSSVRPLRRMSRHGTAWPQNEAEVGQALAESGVPRQEVFITSKVSPYEQGGPKARVACEEILQRLGTDYVVSEAWR